MSPGRPGAVIVDGYNLLHAIPRFAPRGGDVEAGRRALEGWLAEAAARRGVGRVVVVWDGRAGSRSRGRARLEVLYTGPDTSADDRILELCRGPYAGRAGSTWVVSSDRDVQGPARQLGFTALGAMTFYRRWSDRGAATPRRAARGRSRAGPAGDPGADPGARPSRAEVEDLLDELLAADEEG